MAKKTWISGFYYSNKKNMEEQYKNFLNAPEENNSNFNFKENDDARIVESNVLVPGERPTIITALCGYFFVSWSLNIISTVGRLAALPESAKISFNLTGFPLKGVYALVISLLIVVSVFGYWLMKKWGVYLYTVSIIFSVIFALVTIKTISFLFVLSLILPAVMIFTGFKYLNRMS